MRTKGSLFIALFFLVLGIYGLIQSLAFEYWESVALPAVVSGVIITMATIEVGKELYSLGKQGVITTELKLPIEKMGKIELRRFILFTVWVAAFMLCIYLFGFRISIPVYAFLYLKWRGKHLLIAALFALAMLGFVYGVFEVGLKAALFQGIVFGDR
jgi:hypothetical protein